jgi:hypothetical protein
VGAIREFAKDVLPEGALAAYRRGRRRIIRRFGAPITPFTLPGILARTTPGRAATRLLGRSFPQGEAWLRRRIATRGYLSALSYEFDPGTSASPDGQSVAGVHTFRDVVVEETLVRTDEIFQALDRRIEAISARSTERVMALQRKLAALQEEIGRLEAALNGPAPPTS